MARRVVWSPEALEDLADIYHYIKYDNRKAAKKVADRLRNLAKSIPDNPRIGLKCPEHDREDIRHPVWGTQVTPGNCDWSGNHTGWLPRASL